MMETDIKFKLTVTKRPQNTVGQDVEKFISLSYKIPR